MPEPFDLRRFTSAQDEHGTYDRALGELRDGRKVSHWMWFVFPQVAGLGRSATAQHFAIASLEEARAYLDHPVLGPRLIAAARALAELPGERTASAILGGTDALKLRSSMTLFLRAGPDQPVFAQVLDRYFGGEPDPATDERLG
jgi:uncharacterized protein (DUF1810 family)